MPWLDSNRKTLLWKVEQQSPYSNEQLNKSSSDLHKTDIVYVREDQICH